ncbi:hypothetical protein U9M48_029371 [Paspalum notatum var. saurae]|uniref:Uncharacterized protein n=1 Tax=Paspalum notatum var. saurae TaxID=547442 RepID=A0AAQ3TXQ0_PASNO
MPIVEGGRRAGSGSASFGRRGQHSAPAAGGGTASSSPARGRGSDSRAAVLQCDEMEESDGEVQSSYRGPFDTMDSLQDALPNNRKGAFKFYNGKSNYVADVAGGVQSAKDTANPGNPSPKKRKGFLSFSFSWSKSRSKGSSSRHDASNSSKNCRKTLSPALTSSSQRNSRGNNELKRDQGPARRCLQKSPTTNGASASPPGATRAQIIAVQMQSLSVPALEDVAESTNSVSPKEKRRKSLR